MIAKKHIVRRLSIYFSSRLLYYYADGLGSIRQLTDAAGIIGNQYRYGAWGELTPPFSKSESLHNPYSYTSREFSENQLYYYRARYYRSNQFITKDKLISELFTLSNIQSEFVSKYALAFEKDFYLQNLLLYSLSENKEMHLFQMAIDQNMYKYALNSPIQFIDPNGYKADCCFCETEYLANCYKLSWKEYALYCLGPSYFAYKASSGKKIVWRGKLTAKGKTTIHACIFSMGLAAWWYHLNCIPGYIGCKMGCN